MNGYKLISQGAQTVSNVGEQSDTSRLEGLDIARYFAFVGMVIVNFSVVTDVAGGDGVATTIYRSLEGRAAATFVVLAGLGLGLASLQGVSQTVAVTIKRSIFLLTLGLLNMLVFEADILHYYAIFFLLGALVLTIDTWFLVVMILGVNSVFVFMILVLDYDAAWNWELHSYDDFWSVSGFVRHLFFNGWHPVFPWVGFLLFGIILSRLTLWRKETQHILMIFGVLALLLTQVLAKLLQPWLSSIDAELVHLATIKPIPPNPLYSLAGVGAACIAIGLCLRSNDFLKQSHLHNILVQAGRQTLTLYVAHIYIGMSILDVMGLVEGHTANTVLLASLVFCILSAIYAFLWNRLFGRGPIEALMRRLTK